MDPEASKKDQFLILRQIKGLNSATARPVVTLLQADESGSRTCVHNLVHQLNIGHGSESLAVASLPRLLQEKCSHSHFSSRCCRKSSRNTAWNFASSSRGTRQFRATSCNQTLFLLIKSVDSVNMFPMCFPSLNSVLFFDRWHVVAQVQVSTKRKACRRRSVCCDSLLRRN